MVGTKEQAFGKNHHMQSNEFKKITLINDGLSKSARVILSNLIFDFKNQQIFFTQKFRRPFFGRNIIIQLQFLNYFISNII